MPLEVEKADLTSHPGCDCQVWACIADSTNALVSRFVCYLAKFQTNLFLCSFGLAYSVHLCDLLLSEQPAFLLPPSIILSCWSSWRLRSICPTEDSIKCTCRGGRTRCLIILVRNSLPVLLAASDFLRKYCGFSCASDMRTACTIIEMDVRPLTALELLCEQIPPHLGLISLL